MKSVLHCRAALMAAAAVLASAAPAPAQSLLTLDYSNAKTFGSVHIAGGAIDITRGAMIVTTSSFGFVPSGGQNNEYGSPGVAEYGDKAIHDALAEGANYVNGFWDGTNGILSSTAAGDPNEITAVGWVDNSITHYSTFAGIPVSTNESIIAFTYYGDSLLQGTVTSDDYNLWHATYTNPAGNNVSVLTGGPVEWIDGAWFQGGQVTDTDYTLWLTSIHSPFLHPLGWNPTPNFVPEPSTSALLGIGFATLGIALRRRRSR